MGDLWVRVKIDAGDVQDATEALPEPRARRRQRPSLDDQTPGHRTWRELDEATTSPGQRAFVRELLGLGLSRSTPLTRQLAGVAGTRALGAIEARVPGAAMIGAALRGGRAAEARQAGIAQAVSTGALTRPEAAGAMAGARLAAAGGAAALGVSVGLGIAKSGIAIEEVLALFAPGLRGKSVFSDLAKDYAAIKAYAGSLKDAIIDTPTKAVAAAGLAGQPPMGATDIFQTAANIRFRSEYKALREDAIEQQRERLLWAGGRVVGSKAFAEGKRLIQDAFGKLFGGGGRGG